MIIGNGDIATALKELPNRDDIIYFASGVSNSKEVRLTEFQREVNLLLSMDYTKHLVYFSSLAILDVENPYYTHKKSMQNLVLRFRSYTVFFIGNIDWGKNPHTFLNYLKAHPDAEYFEECRILTSKESFLSQVQKLKVGEKEYIIITGKNIWVPDLKGKL